MKDIERSNRGGVTTEIIKTKDGKVSSVKTFKETMSDFLKRVSEIEFQEAVYECRS